MKVKYVGEEVRVNSFGKFEPGKTYDVSDKVGEQLLTVPLLFEQVGKARKAKTAEEEVMEVRTSEDTTDISDVLDDIKEPEIDYDSFNIKKLEKLVQERGVGTRRGARKAELIEALEEYDRTKNG
jgi:hypothetical protein